MSENLPKKAFVDDNVRYDPFSRTSIPFAHAVVSSEAAFDGVSDDILYGKDSVNFLGSTMLASHEADAPAQPEQDS